MNKKLTALLPLLPLLLLPSCTKASPDAVSSSRYAAYGNRLYSVEVIEHNGSYLAYTDVTPEGEIGDEFHYACTDPLCSHDRSECAAWSNSGGDIAIVPKSNGCTVYYFRANADDPWMQDFMAFDMASGKCTRVTTLPSEPAYTYIIADGFAYFSLNTADENNVHSINIFRAPLSGGKTEQVTFAENINDGCRLDFCENGYIYFRRGNDLYRTVDFTSEELIKSDLSLLWDIQFHDGWMYYADNLETIYYKADEEKPEGYQYIYNYSNDYITEDTLDGANSCSIVRTNIETGETETVIDGVTPAYALFTSKWNIIDNTLYCIPTKFEYQGKIEWSDFASPDSLTYIWSETGGSLIAVDLDTLESREVMSGLDYDITSIESAGDGRILVTSRVFDIDKINEYYKTHPHLGSDLRYSVRYIFDTKEWK